MIARTQIVLGKSHSREYQNSAKEDISMYDLKYHKVWFDEEWFRFLD